MKTILLIIFLYPVHVFAPPHLSKQDVIKAWEFHYLTQPFTPALLNSALELYVKYPKIALAQSKLETGYFTSDIWKENKNLFGMKHPKIRPTYSMGEARKSAVYNHWLYSVKDYRLMQDWYFDRGKDMDYFLTVYCPGKHYKRTVKNLM